MPLRVSCRVAKRRPDETFMPADGRQQERFADTTFDFLEVFDEDGRPIVKDGKFRDPKLDDVT